MNIDPTSKIDSKTKDIDPHASLDSIDDCSDHTAFFDDQLPEVPGYEIIEELGRGGMGIVYLAKQLSVNRMVALKTVEISQISKSVDRSKTEAEAVAQLQHPNIIQLFDFGVADGRQIFSMELVEGGDLESNLKSGLPTQTQAAEWAETIARAIDYAHQRNIVHRDLKPANIMISKSGELKIADFGLAKKTDCDQSKTQMGDIVGTPHYMSPEQASGDIQKLGPSTDIFSIGAILYDMVIGESPFQSSTILETLEAIRTKDPVMPRKINKNISPDLEKICLKCLQKNPRHRYQSALDLAEDLRRFLNHEPVLARPISKVAKLYRRALQFPVASTMILLLFALVVISLAGFVRLSNTIDEGRQEVEQAIADRAVTLDVPLGLKSVSIPSDNPLTLSKVRLGKELFFDKRLSVDNSVACADCHDPKHGWSDGRAVSVGVAGKTGTRNSPSVVNASHQRWFFWDGRAEDFEEQSLGPLLNPLEMGNPTKEFIVEKISQIESYEEQFEIAFDDGLTALNISKALAAFQRTLNLGGTPYDRFKAGDETALSESAQRGMKLFFNKANCSACHSGRYFSDGGFHNIGLPFEPGASIDAGRESITGLLGDRRSFKTPGLRNVATTAPYMHNGSLSTIEEVIDHYVRGGDQNEQQDEEIFPLKLTDEEKEDLIIFLKEGLTNTEDLISRFENSYRR